MSVFVQAAADNRMRVWLDGAEIITAGFNGDATEITSSWDGVISEGTHLLAAETTNFQSPTPGDNYGWFLCTVMKKILNKPVGVVTHTDSSWYAYYKGDANVPYRDEVTTGTKTVTTEKKVSVKYKVRSGDTLSAIGRKYGVPWRKIYKANKKKIDDRAARSGLPNNGPGWWIFPGQILVIPGKYKTTSSTASVPSTSTKRVWSAGEALSTKRPGWYPHQILAKVFSEAKSRGVRSLASTELGFAFGFDSEGESWPTGHEEVVERSFRIASSVYEVAQELVEGGIDIRMGPDLVLRAYNQLGSYRGIGVAREDRFHLLDVGNSTLKYKIGRSTDLYNSLLIDTDLGWRNFSTPSGDEIGLSEGGASLGGMNADRIAHAIGAELEELSRKTKTVSTTFRIVPGRLPYVDFDLGDIVVGHDEQGNVFDARITAIGIEEKSEYDIRCEVEASGEGLS
jgi:LysM repeat protein